MTPSIPTETWAARSRSGSSSAISRISPVAGHEPDAATAPDRLV